jgi:5'-deoxynucleotidase YfbR-like HD superfamily hydrolase
MDKRGHEEAQRLIEGVILPFYGVKRDMLIPNEDYRVENDAEHSWSLAIVACSLASRIDPSLDVGLVSQFASVHDLAEVVANDTSVWADEADLESKHKKEEEAIATLRERFASSFPWLIETLETYERLDTPEARYVRAMDKYIALCIRFKDGGKFYRAQHITKEIFDAKLASHREKAYSHLGVAEYYEHIRADYDNHPEHFYPSR